MARRLAAIMFTDLVGSTQLAQRDERSALQLLREQGELARPVLAAHHGRLVKSTGDGFLAEFANALDAVECAVDFQRRAHERSARVERPPMNIRIGIHVGDVESEGEDILGDAVNVASRVETLAAAGGVCLSSVVWEHVRNKVPFAFESLGRKSLKGVLDPLEIYRVVLPWQSAAAPVAVALDRTRVAVLPLVSMSPDPADEYFADGMTEELIDRLAQVKRLAVIARTSIMSYKKTTKKASEIAQELSAGSLVEGSIRKAGNRVRITVQLIHSGTEAHLWSNRYDRDLDDVFAVQTEIAERVAEELNVRLLDSEKQVLAKKATENTEAYGLFLRGRELFLEGSDPSMRRALDFYEKALTLDPDFARAHVGEAECHQWFGTNGAEPGEVALAAVRASLQRALALDPDLPEAHAALSMLHMNEDDGPAWEAEARRALELNPSLPGAHFSLYTLASIKGELNEMVREVETAHRLDPLASQYVNELGLAYLFTGREKELLDLWQQTEHVAPRATAGVKTWYYLSKGDLQRAGEYFSRRESLQPTSTPSIWLTYVGGILAALNGQKEKAQLAVRQLEQDPNLKATGLTYIGEVYWALGDLDSCFDYWNRALEAHTLVATDVMCNPLFGNLRSDPRFQGLTEKLRRRLGFGRQAS